jgi:hypothetical protein
MNITDGESVKQLVLKELKTLISRLFVGREPALAQMVHIILDRCAPVLKKIYLK